MDAQVWFDGACSGNPGPMGAGAIVEVGGTRHGVSEALGHGSNNEAEYGGLLLALRMALQAGATSVTVHGDSQLVLRQLDGTYAVKAPNLRPLHRQARRLLDRFDLHRLVWVPRDANQDADAAARDALSQA